MAMQAFFNPQSKIQNRELVLDAYIVEADLGAQSHLIDEF